MAVPRGRRIVAGSTRPRPDTHNLLGPLDESEVVGVTVVVRPKPGSPPLRDLDDWHATPVAQRRYLTAGEYAQRHGAAADDLAEVARFAAAHGLAVRESHAGRRSVTLTGTAAQLGSAFGVTLNRYEAPVPRSRMNAPDDVTGTHVHHGYDGAVHVPSELSEIILGVVGLDDRRIGGPAGGTGDPSGAARRSVAATAGTYNFPNTGASDQTIGVVTMGGAYSHQDVTGNYFPNLSDASYQTPPGSLNDISLQVGTTTYSNSAATVAQITGANLNSFNQVMELTQDICTSTTVAQGADVNVYFTENSEQGWLVLLNRVLQPEAEAQPTVVTCSWFVWSSDDAGSIGKLSDSGSIVSLLTAQFQSLASLGIDVFIALGDWGADNGVIDGSAHVQYAASDPWVTSCGATVLALDASDPKGFVEKTWSDSFNTASPFGSSNDFGSTGGGVSATFPAPPYQTAIGVTGATDSGGTVRSGRGVPDVAAMVGYSGSGSHDWYYANGVTYFYQGTSCVAPLMAGLAAVIRSALGRAVGPFNTVLYQLATVAFNDVVTGNNDSGDTPDSPYFTAGAGWDATTGLGSVDGTKLLNGIVGLLYSPTFYFQVNKGSFGLDEVSVTSAYPKAMWLVLEGFTPAAVSGLTQLPMVEADLPGITIKVGAAQPELPSEPSTPQRILFPCQVSFSTAAAKPAAQGGDFPDQSTPPVSTVAVLVSSLVIGGQVLSAVSEITLEQGADPYFANYDPAGTNLFYRSQDLRVFTVTPGVNPSPVSGATLSPANSTTWDTGAAYTYIKDLLAHLNGRYADPAAGDAFASFPDQSNALTGDSSVTPTSINPADATGTPFANYNFAVARVRLSGQPSTSSGDNVRVLFRMFAAETSDTDYQPLTYRATTDPDGQPLAPELAAGAVTIPFFATGNYQANADFGINADYSANSINNQPIPIGASGQAYAYYGCYLNIYPTQNTISGTPVQALLPSSHSCVVAQLAYDEAPMPTTPGLLQGPEYSTNFAQRNLQITFSDNPGPAAAHRVPQTFDARPSPLPGTGQLEGYPDELMIDWADTPVGATASIYWPQVSSADVLDLADELYSTHQLRAADAHTVECTVPSGFTFVPIPAGGQENLAGLFTVDLPTGVRSGQEFTITVRRLSTRRVPAQVGVPVPPPPTAPPPPKLAGAGGQPDHGRRPRMDNWRYIVGTFAVRMPVTTKDTMLPLEENTLAIMKWRLSQQHLTPSNRWVPVLTRYIEQIEGRINALGGNATAIEPSPYGYRPRPERRPDRDGLDVTGKIDGIAYDRFGDFEGFFLRTECGGNRMFRSREAEIESLARYAWAERIVISVLTEDHDGERPVRLTLRRLPLHRA